MNGINIFPVPDSDTGSNLAKTFSAIQHTIQDNTYSTSKILIHAVLEAALSSSQGNSGIIMVSYLHGFLSFLQGKEPFHLQDIVDAAEKGAYAGRNAIEHPKEGTILDVMDAFASGLQEEQYRDIKQSFHNAVEITKKSLIATEYNMALLKEKHVVDAGALGFTSFVIGMYEGLTNQHIVLDNIDMQPVEKDASSFGEFPYEVIFIVENSPFSSAQLKDMFHSLGDSLDIASIEHKTKVHIHTHVPEVVEQTAQLIGTIVSIQTVDMRISASIH